jgi:nitrogen fixation NifU-like protein
MSAYGSVVIEHFRRPRNQGRLASPDFSVEGANPLCGDRVRMEARIAAGVIEEVGFTADACALCVASASLLTERVRGMAARAVAALDDAAVYALVGGKVPKGRDRCVRLPLDTLRRGLRDMAPADG